MTNLQMSECPIPYDELTHGLGTSVSVDTINEVNDEVFVEHTLNEENNVEPSSADEETVEERPVEEIDISDLSESQVQIDNITEQNGDEIEEVKIKLVNSFLIGNYKLAVLLKSI